MSELTHKPQQMTYEELARLLHWLADRIEEGDPYEGFVEYLMPTEIGVDIRTVDVRARFRTGNRMGQGGMTFIGELS